MRPLLLVLLLAGVFSFASCSGDDEHLTVPSTTITPRPRTSTPTESGATGTPDTEEPTSTSTPDGDSLPGDVLAQLLERWSTGRYSDIYDLLSTAAQQRISRVDFVKRYRAIAEEVGITGVEGFASTADRAASLQSYAVTISTHLFGDIKEKNVASFVQEDRWRVDWNPSLIFKDLSGPNLIHRFGLEPKRGAILDRNGEPLALTVNVTEVGVSKATIGDTATTVQYLADRLGLNVDEIYAKIKPELPDYYFIPIVTLPYNVDAALLAELQANEHLVLRQATMRVYPNGSMASHVLGYMGVISPDELEELKNEGYTDQDIVGKAGIEAIYERELAGTRGAKLTVISPEGATLTVIAERPTTPGHDVTLSLDVHAQGVAEVALGQRAGAAVLIDPRDNSILAMANYPRFDPNRFITGLSSAEYDALANDPLHPLFNRATQGRYPPGSTFKVITAAAGLEKGGYTAESTFPCPPIWYGLGADNPKKNWNPANEGSLTVAGGLMRSCNPVFYDIGLRLDQTDPEILPSFAEAFGLGQPTGVIGVAEEAGVSPGPKWKEDNVGEPWYTGDAVNMAIGQGFTVVTPLQLANVYSSLATSKLRTPVLVKEISAPGMETQRFESELVHELPVSEETLAIVREGMRRVTSDPRGTAYNVFAGSPLEFAGKSGTAEDVGVADHVWFAAYAPRSDPQAVCVAVFEEGKSGSQEVGPVVRKIIEGWLLGD